VLIDAFLRAHYRVQVPTVVFSGAQH